MYRSGKHLSMGNSVFNGYLSKSTDDFTADLLNEPFSTENMLKRQQLVNFFNNSAKERIDSKTIKFNFDNFSADLN